MKYICVRCKSENPILASNCHNCGMEAEGMLIQSSNTANVDEEDARYAYMCEIDFNWELGDVPITKLYGSIKSLKKDHPMAEECGIVKVKIVRADDT